MANIKAQGIKWIMLWFIIGIIIVSLLSVGGCNKQSEIAQYCSDHVDLKILNYQDLDPNLCYTDSGIVRLILYNAGDVPIQNFYIDFVGEKQRFEKDLPLGLGAQQVLPLDIAFSIKETGDLRTVTIYPRINYENKTVLCWNSKRFIKALERCDVHG